MAEAMAPTNGSVIKDPPKSQGEAGGPGPGPIGDVVFALAGVADEFPQWGSNSRTRDVMLRNFFPKEPMVASAVYSTVSRYASFPWSLEGPSRTVGQVQRVLQGCEFGKGWTMMMSKVLTDLFTQDNGAFIEVVRSEDSPTSPVLSMNHLDAAKCVRTGRRDEPFIYYDRESRGHLFKWYHGFSIEEMPSPIEAARGMQYCALTRMLVAAQIMRDIEVYRREKISGRFNRAVHLVGGVQARTITDAISQHKEIADQQGLVRYIQPVIVAALDPTSRVSHEEILLSSLPDNFDYEQEMKWYITQLALAFGQDYQDFAPLPSGNLGTSQQSQILHLKSRGKGPALFMSIMEGLMNFMGVVPNTIRFKYGVMDAALQMEEAQLKKARAEERAVRITSGEINTKVARQMALDSGDLTETELAMMEEEDQSPDIEVESGIPPDANDANPTDTEPGPKMPPSVEAHNQASQGGIGAGNSQRGAGATASRTPSRSARSRPGTAA